jgi:hypothetical protein
MGTRNLTKVIDANGVVKVAQYGQWDGYPSGQGMNALYHAHNHKQIEKGLARVRWAEQEELDKIYSSLPEMNRYGTDDSDAFGLLYPNLTRDTCADILGVVAWSVGEVILVDESAFEKDDLFCEGVYTIDFQQRKFISWYGGQTVEFSLDALPTREEYLTAFGYKREEVAV